MAANCWLWPTTSDVVPVTAIDRMVGGVELDVLLELPLPHPIRNVPKIAITESAMNAAALEGVVNFGVSLPCITDTRPSRTGIRRLNRDIDPLLQY